MSKWLSCSISPGQFPTEFAVAGRHYTDKGGVKGYSLFAPIDSVISLSSAAEGPGLVQVDVIDSKDDLVLVKLPAQTFENGQHITVKQSELQDKPAQRIGA